MEPLETKEKVEEAVAGHGGSNSGRRIGLLIAALAALLALTETGGKSAQTEALNANVQATDLWSIFSSKDGSAYNHSHRCRARQPRAPARGIPRCQSCDPEADRYLERYRGPIRKRPANQRGAQRAERAGKAGRD